MRIFVAIFGIVASILYMVFLVIAVESNGRISQSEFLPASLGFLVVAVLVALWIVRFMDEKQPEKRKKRR